VGGEVAAEAMHASARATIQLRKRHGGTFGNRGDEVLEQFQLSGSRQGLGAAVGAELAVEVVDVGLYGTHADGRLRSRGLGPSARHASYRERDAAPPAPNGYATG
jgi:hypothetical protein